MPVVINSFEVATVASPDATRSDFSTPEPPAPASQTQQEADLSRLLSRRRERQSRVRAH
jgi:hypothetical protein